MDYWNSNLRFLQKKNPLLAQYIAGLKDSENIAVVKSISGIPTLKAINNLGQEKFLFSPTDPVSEARLLVNNLSFNGEDGTILFGFGLGYLAREISKKKDPDHVLYVVEGIPELFKLSMIHTDLSDMLSDDNTYFFVGDSISTILDNFTPIQAKIITGAINKLAIPSLRELCEQQYDEIDKQINSHVTFLHLSFTSFNDSKEIRLANLFNNVPAILNSSPVDKLKNSIQNRPAFIVAAGPSLKQDIKALGNRPENSIIICVDAALKPILQNNIKPDAVITCDPYPDNFNKVEGLPGEILNTIPLVYQGEATSKLIEQFSGSQFIANAHNSLTQWITNIDRSIVTFPYFPSVSHFGFLMARYMGADPIILVGLDLSFPIDQEHADGCAETWKLDFDKTEFIWVPNNTGGKVKTIPGFFSMIHSLEYEIKKTRARCINVSADGAMIKGAEWMPLEDAFKLAKRKKMNGRSEKVNSNTVELKNDIFSTDPIISFKNIIEEAFFVDTAQLKDKYSDALAWMISEVGELSVICRDAKAILDRSRQNNLKPIEKINTMERLQMAYTSAFKHNVLLDVLTDYLPKYMILISKDRTERLAAENVSSRMTDWKHITVFFEELSDVLPLLEKHCRQAFANLRKKDNLR
jgi:hypothetical protein